MFVQSELTRVFFRFISGLLGDLSSQIDSAAAAAAAARGRAELLLQQSRVMTPHHRLLQHDVLLLSSSASSEPNFGSELLGEELLQEGARLARDSLSVFPLQVTCDAVCGAVWLVLLQW